MTIKNSHFSFNTSATLFSVQQLEPSRRGTVERLSSCLSGCTSLWFCSPALSGLLSGLQPRTCSSDRAQPHDMQLNMIIIAIMLLYNRFSFRYVFTCVEKQWIQSVFVHISHVWCDIKRRRKVEVVFFSP